MRQHIKLGLIIRQIRGVSYKPTDVKAAGDPNAVALLRANNIQDEGLNFDDLVYIDKKKVSSEQMIQKGDIVICSSSGSKNLVGKAAVADNDYPVAFGAFCKVVRVLSMNSAFVGQYFRSPRYRREISEASSGANINNIRNEHIDEMLLPIYSEGEQAEIARKLTHIDTLIGNRQAQLTLIDQLVKSRFVEMFGEGYPEDSLLNLCNIIDYRGKTPEKVDSGLPFITAKNIRMHYMSMDSQEFISKETYDKVMVRGFPKEGDVVFTTEAPLGNVCRIPHFDTEFYIGQRIVTLQTEKLEPIYLEYALDTDDFEQKLNSKASGSTVTGIRVRLLEQLTIPVPPRAMQNQFATFVEQVDKSKLAVQQSLEKLETLKKSLMQQYFG